MLPVGESGSPVQHFGSASDLTTYTTSGHVFFANLDMYPVEKLNLYIKGSYTLAKGDFERVEMKLPQEYVHHADYDYTNIHTYSDISQSILEVSGGARYTVSEHVGIFGNMDYVAFDDDEPWVYRDQTGDYYATTLGATITF